MKTFGITVLGVILGFFAYDWGNLDREHTDNQMREAIRVAIRDEFRKQEAKG